MRSCRLSAPIPQDGPFIFTSFASEKKEEDSSTAGPVEWLCGETASVEVEISNPTDVHIKVRTRLRPWHSALRARYHRASAHILAMQLSGDAPRLNWVHGAVWLVNSRAAGFVAACLHRLARRWLMTNSVFVRVSRMMKVYTWAIAEVERLTLEAQHVGDPALPHSSVAGPSWKPNPVALWVKPGTAPTRVLLQGTPLSRGLYVLTGCRMTVLGITWLQPWVPRKPSLGAAGPR